MNKKLLAAGQLFAAAALILTACSAPAATTAPSATTAPAATMAPAATEAMEPTAEATMGATMEATAETTAETTALPNVMTVGETAMADNQFSTLVELAIAAGITPTLTGPGPITVFAPTNEAFAKLPAATVDALKADPEKLKAVLTYHVLGSKVTSADVAGMGGSGEPETLNGATISVTTKDGSVFVNDAKVIKADIEASNGVIHVIDSVLLPPDMADASMAPTETMTGTEAMTETMPMTDTEMMTETEAMTSTGSMTDTMAPLMSAGETAMANSDFSTLVELAIAAGITPTLTGPGPITVFAPTNEAFAKLPAETVAALKADPEKLKAVLTYHVLGAKVTSADVAGMGGSGEPETLNGATISVTTKDGSVFVNDAKVIKADIMTSNGVIHVIDTVLIPPTK